MSILGGMSPINPEQVPQKLSEPSTDAGHPSDPPAAAAVDPEKCIGGGPHIYVRHHEPGHLLYWVSQCQVCRRVDWDSLDAEIRGLFGNDHFVTFTPETDGWTLEHSTDCRLSGNMSGCRYNEAVVRFVDEYATTGGRWRIAEVGQDGFPILEVVEKTT